MSISRVISNILSKSHYSDFIAGSRDAWKTSGNAVGIALCAKRNTRITVGHSNPQNELIQFLSDDMLIVIPS